MLQRMHDWFVHDALRRSRFVGGRLAPDGRVVLRFRDSTERTATLPTVGAPCP